MKNEVSAVILTKGEDYNLIDCINHLKNYVDEIIIICSDDNDITKNIANDMNCFSYNIKIGEYGINGFADLRNFGNSKAKNDWILHADVDELFSDDFLINIHDIINNSDDKIAAYDFPRINTPFYEKWPDYQTRLINKKMTIWFGNVHEKITINNISFKTFKLDNYPIIHKDKSNKIEINKRWENNDDKKSFLIISMFKNGELYINEFLKCLLKLINFSIFKNYDISLCFIESESEDNTHEILRNYLNKFEDKGMKRDLIELNISNELSRFDRLAILRNMSIKFGLENEKYILMIDSDTTFDEDLLFNLTESLEKNKCDVLSPMIFIDNFKDYGSNYFYDTLAFIQNGNNFHHFYPYIKCNYINNGIMEMDSVGTCYLMKSEIINIKDFNNYNILKCYREIENGKSLIYYSGGNISEQVRFFNKVKNAGYKICTDTSIKINHVNYENLGLRWH